MEKRAVELVTERNAGGKGFRVDSSVPRFLDGTLVFVGFTDRDGDEDENWVHFPDYDHEDPVVYSMWVDVVSAVTRHEQPGMFSIARDIVSFGGIAGVIAIILTGTFAYVVVSGTTPKDTTVTEVMKSALMAILGFYFGSKVAKK